MSLEVLNKPKGKIWPALYTSIIDVKTNIVLEVDKNLVKIVLLSFTFLSKFAISCRVQAS